VFLMVVPPSKSFFLSLFVLSWRADSPSRTRVREVGCFFLPLRYSVTLISLFFPFFMSKSLASESAVRSPRLRPVSAIFITPISAISFFRFVRPLFLFSLTFYYPPSVVLLNCSFTFSLLSSLLSRSLFLPAGGLTCKVLVVSPRFLHAGRSDESPPFCRTH